MKIHQLKEHVCALSQSPNFIHHLWFVEHHLEIIEKIVAELLEKYPEAQETVVRAMVWVHDWGKILTNKGPNEKKVTEEQISLTLPSFGFTPEEISHIREVFKEMEDLTPRKDDFMIETKIISSADALAHYVGPFFALYWYENSNMSIPELIANNLKKAEKDTRKIMLPEVERAAKVRIKYLKEFSASHRPQKYLTF